MTDGWGHTGSHGGAGELIDLEIGEPPFSGPSPPAPRWGGPRRTCPEEETGRQTGEGGGAVP